jgi:uncharacterized protein (TIGR03000 family)
MNKNWLWTSVVLVLASAGFWLTPSTAHAQRWRGDGWGWRGSGYPYYGGYGYRYGYYPGYSYYPRYSSGFYYPSYSYSYYSPTYTYPSYYYDASPTYVPPAPSTTVYQSPLPAPQEGTTAQIAVHVPAPDAIVWIAGKRMTQSGTDRTFATPTLTAGRTYSYEIRAQWTTASGQLANQTRTVSFQPGQTVTVDFTTAAASY